MIKGPPEQDAVMQIGSIQLFFNSSNPLLKSQFQDRCQAAKSNQPICNLTTVLSAPWIAAGNDAEAVARGWVGEVGAKVDPTLLASLKMNEDGTITMKGTASGAVLGKLSCRLSVRSS